MKKLRQIKNEEYLDIFINVLVDMMIKNKYETISIDQLLVIRNQFRKEANDE